MKYTKKEHADHLLATLEENYIISHNWSGSGYLGMDIGWDCASKEAYIVILSYVQDAPKRFHNIRPRREQGQPHPHVKLTYRAKAQYIRFPTVLTVDKKFIQEVTGTFLYYARVVDATMLLALGTTVTQQSNPTENIMKKVKHFLDYAATHPNAIITYRASNIVLTAHSNASYFLQSKAQSRAGGHFFVSVDSAIPANNGAVITVSKIIKAVMSSVAEAELWTLFINCREAILARHALKIIGHKQPPHHNADQERNSTGSVHQQHSKQAPEVHGHEALLTLLPISAETVLPLLATRAHNPRGLRDETPRIYPLSSGLWNIPDTKI